MSTDQSYYSFLICNHAGRLHVYFNGLPVGVIVDGQLQPCLNSLLPKRRAQHLGIDLDELVTALKAAQACLTTTPCNNV